MRNTQPKGAPKSGTAMMNLDEETATFYFELGLALSQWAHVEHLVF
jgi:hypothetical protein